MAARKKYPSDFRRWFKVTEDILDDERLEECSADVFRFYIKVQAMLKRANSTDGCITLSRRAINACSGRNHFRYGLEVASNGAELGLYSLRTEGEFTVITVPNWAKSQEPAPKEFRVASEPAPDSRVEQSRVEQSRVKDKAKLEQHPSAEPLSLLFFEQLHEHVEGWTPPSTTTMAGWRQDLDRMLRLDGPQKSGIPADQIEIVIRWVVLDDFERPNVQCPQKLRKRFPALYSKATAQPKQQTRPTGVSSVWKN